MTGLFPLEVLHQRLLPESSLLESLEGVPDAAVAIIIDAKIQGGSALFIKRSDRPGDPWSGQIAFPGGHRSTIDRSLRDTAIREANEEVGVCLSNHQMLGVLSPIRAHTRRILVAPFIFQLISNVSLKLNDEVTESFWIPLSLLSDLNVGKSNVEVEDGVLTVDAYTYEGRVIWGLTFRILNSLLAKNM